MNRTPIKPGAGYDCVGANKRSWKSLDSSPILEKPEHRNPQGFRILSSDLRGRNQLTLATGAHDSIILLTVHEKAHGLDHEAMTFQQSEVGR